MNSTSKKIASFALACVAALGAAQQKTPPPPAEKVAKITLSIATVQGGNTAVATVELSAKAGTAGSIVTLSSGNPAASVPATVTVAPGQLTVGFTVTTIPVAANASVPIKATLNGGTATTTLIVAPPALTEMTFSPNMVTGGANSTVTLKLNSPAPAGGLKLNLSASSPAWGGPSSITFTAGATVAALSFTTVPVADHNDSDVSATLNGVKVGATLGIDPPHILSFSVAQSTLVGGNSTVGTIVINGAAPKQGFKIAITSDSPLAKAPTIVTVPAGATSVTFSIATQAGKAGAARIDASAPAASIELLLTIKSTV